MKVIEAINHFGCAAWLAEEIGVHRSTVSKWESRGGIVPIKQAWKIERKSGGKVPMRLGDYR